MTNEIHDAVDEMFSDYLSLRQQGDTPAMEAYVAQYPAEHRQALREKITEYEQFRLLFFAMRQYDAEQIAVSMPQKRVDAAYQRFIQRAASKTDAPQQIGGWTAILEGGLHPLATPAFAVGGVLGLILIGILVWQLIPSKVEHTTIELADATYHVWGESVDVAQMEVIVRPPALNPPQSDRFVGFFTPQLIDVLRKPAGTEAFWKSLSAALAEQEIHLEPLPRAFVIEVSLFDAMKSQQNVTSRNFSIVFTAEHILLMHWFR